MGYQDSSEENLTQINYKVRWAFLLSSAMLVMINAVGRSESTSFLLLPQVISSLSSRWRLYRRWQRWTGPLEASLLNKRYHFIHILLGMANHKINPISRTILYLLMRDSCNVTLLGDCGEIGPFKKSVHLQNQCTLLLRAYLFKKLLRLTNWTKEN